VIGVRRYKLLHAPVAVDSMEAWIRRYLEAVMVAQFSAHTLRTRKSDLSVFYAWCEDRGVVSPREISQAILERFQKHLFYLRKADGQPLRVGSQQKLLRSVQMFFRWLTKHGHLPADPASALELPRVSQRMLPEALTLEEVERVLGVLDLSNLFELRDRAVLEVMYSTGMRRMEVRGLSLYDIDAKLGTVFVRQGKGRKDRVVPIGERALAWIEKYTDEVRPHLSIDPKQTTLFLNKVGGALSLTALTDCVRRYFERAGITRPGSCHLFRHTMATLMLEHGADIRYIQEILGHSNLETTQRYTHVSIVKLREIHAACHPGAKLQRKSKPDTDGDAPAA
jgi:integrase/recombinase XerD